jgi:murein DD-endopeptidase MepM/ murein hydrolase activator NlpD
MRNCWSLKLSRVALFIIAISPLHVSAQFSFPPEKFSDTLQEKYLYPIRPGLPGSLAGTMGELRTTHFHSGIDIRTDNRIGAAVRASKSGYISRASMGPVGYGNVIYIIHPDGNTTVYGHLDKFRGPLADFVLSEQYRIQSSEIDLFFQEGQFRVKQGDTIAWSGNSGSSGGPHLHFNIQDSNNRALNPLVVASFPEIQDKLPPAVEKIALRTMDINSRINDRYGRFEFYAQRVGNNFILKAPILAHGTIGIEILSKDKLAYQSPFYGGVNDIEVQVNGQRVFAQAIEKINLTEPRGIYTLMDFRTMRMKGTRFYKLYIDDGNSLEFYGNSPGHGKITLAEGTTSNVDILLKDSYRNGSKVSFKLQYDPIEKRVPNLESMKRDTEVELIENTYVVSTRPGTKAQVYINGQVQDKEPDYFNTLRTVFLFDLRKALPDSIVINGKALKPGFKVTVPPTQEYTYYSDWMDVKFPADAVYDTLYLAAEHTTLPGSEVFTIGSPLVPLNKSIHVSLKTEREYLQEQGYAVYRAAGKFAYTYIGGEWINGRLQFITREFGNFTLLKDSIAPTITPLSINNNTVRFKIRDNLSGVATFKASVNDAWLLMHYDAKTATIWSERQDKEKPLSGVFELEVVDNAGNKQIYRTNL